MGEAIPVDVFKQALRLLLTEAFEQVEGIFLDRGTSLFETLGKISAEQASIPVGGRCATLAAQVKHVAFYLDVVERFVRTGKNERVDWDEIWRTTGAVSAEEWAAIQDGLRGSYQRIQAMLDELDNFSNVEAAGGAMGLLAHSAYHLGEIRQATCMLKP